MLTEEQKNILLDDINEFYGSHLGRFTTYVHDNAMFGDEECMDILLNNDISRYSLRHQVILPERSAILLEEDVHNGVKYFRAKVGYPEMHGFKMAVQFAINVDEKINRVNSTYIINAWQYDGTCYVPHHKTYVGKMNYTCDDLSIVRNGGLYE